MALRKAAAYTKKKARPYTRKSKNRSKSYIKVIPQNKIVKYNLGNIQAYNDGKFKYLVSFVADEKAQIRDNALESGRLVLNKNLEKKVPKQFYIEIKVYPHHILRNNKTAAGAGADRLSSGMKHSFGVVEGRAAMVNPGKEIFFVACETEQVARIARDVMRILKSKMPCKSKIVMNLNKK
ncbi:50S ribosomal protein L16 [Candidatus Parvarchaeota archaeon]|jgi:large subunit ribosomal protein L10e|nr:MAG: 50S ribosomal protein L16 [Candidatus Parvarchaeota archaeon]HIG52242.1 50S ribosomal protein L16 [Candidatus Pacearchaeota archaeon]